jgi:hypothetical protein
VALRAQRRCIAYIISNARLSRNEEKVKLQTISTAIDLSGVNDSYRMYLVPDYHRGRPIPFDQAYMRSLYDYGGGIPLAEGADTQ